MSTRKLILTALLCGVLIIGAGGFKLWQTVRDGNEVTLLALGTSAKVGEMTARVDGIEVNSERTLVRVSLVGVDGANAKDGWKLLSGGEISEPISLPPGSGTECATTSLTLETSCTIAFPVSKGTRTVAYVRAGEQRQWATGK